MRCIDGSKLRRPLLRWRVAISFASRDLGFAGSFVPRVGCMITVMLSACLSAHRKVFIIEMAFCSVSSKMVADLTPLAEGLGLKGALFPLIAYQEWRRSRSTQNTFFALHELIPRQRAMEMRKCTL